MLGGVPFDKIRYDNLRRRCTGCCSGATARESGRWLAFRAHYGFDAFYCLPGKEGAHEKGGVEGDGGRFRRTHLVPVPQVDTLAELNARLVAADLPRTTRHIDGRAESVGAAFAVEAPLLAAARRAVRHRVVVDRRGSIATPRSWSARSATRCRPG